MAALSMEHRLPNAVCTHHGIQLNLVTENHLIGPLADPSVQLWQLSFYFYRA